MRKDNFNGEPEGIRNEKETFFVKSDLGVDRMQ